MKKIFYFLFATVLCGGFIACEGLNDDAENENGNENENENENENGELSYEHLFCCCSVFR